MGNACDGFDVVPDAFEHAADLPVLALANDDVHRRHLLPSVVVYHLHNARPCPVEVWFVWSEGVRAIAAYEVRRQGETGLKMDALPRGVYSSAVRAGRGALMLMARQTPALPSPLAKHANTGFLTGTSAPMT